MKWTRPVYPRPSEDAVDYLGRRYGIEVIEFPNRPDRSIAICAGTGLMLSLMDAVPRLRWCIDVDGLNREQLAAMTPWLTCIGNVTDLIVVAGWYCSTNPLPLASAVRCVNGDRARVYVQCRGVGGDPFADLRTANSLEQLIEQANQAGRVVLPERSGSKAFLASGRALQTASG
jgi:hypothetical protein